MCIRWPVVYTMSFTSNLISHVSVVSRFVCSRFCAQAKLSLFLYEMVKYHISVAVDFLINIEPGP